MVEKSNNEQKIAYIDAMRIVGSIFIVFMHVSTMILMKPLRYNAEWYLSVIVNSVAFCAVPLFFMISGYLLTRSEKTDDVKVLFKQRLPRLILPLLFWSIMYILWELYVTTDSTLTFKELFFKMLHEPVNISLWFMYALIGIYLISPFICPILKKLDKQKENLLIGIIVFVELLSILRIIYPQFCEEYLNFGIINYINFFDGYLSAFIIGWFLGNTKRHYSNVLLWIIFSLTLIIVIFGTISASNSADRYVSVFQTQNAGYELIIAACLFLIFKQSNKFNGKKTKKIIFELSKYTFPIYLMHNLLIFIYDEMFVSSSLTIWSKTLVIYIIALLIAYILSFIPIVSYVTCGIKHQKLFKHSTVK